MTVQLMPRLRRAVRELPVAIDQGPSLLELRWRMRAPTGHIVEGAIYRIENAFEARMSGEAMPCASHYCRSLEEARASVDIFRRTLPDDHEPVPLALTTSSAEPRAKRAATIVR